MNCLTWREPKGIGDPLPSRPGDGNRSRGGSHPMVIAPTMAAAFHFVLHVIVAHFGL